MFQSRIHISLNPDIKKEMQKEQKKLGINNFSQLVAFIFKAYVRLKNEHKKNK